MTVFGWADRGMRSKLQLVQRPRTPVMSHPKSSSATVLSRPQLQLVQRPRTPVMIPDAQVLLLQWVQRPRTPVMTAIGPSENRGDRYKLQWVQRPRTPVMLTGSCLATAQLRLQWSPASENAGYAGRIAHDEPVYASLVQRPRTPVMLPPHGDCLPGRELQLVQRPRTPVMRATSRTIPKGLQLNGPASENAGYAVEQRHRDRGRRLQLVQRPRTPVMVPEWVRRPLFVGYELQLVQRPRTPVMAGWLLNANQGAVGFNWSSVRERRLWCMVRFIRLTGSR